MKRRRFLSLLGAATAAPILPLPAVAAAPAAGYSPAAMHAAILHAQTSGHVSVQGLSHLLRLPTAGAEKLMEEMTRRGILGPMPGTNPALGWAKSRIYKPRFAMRVPTQRTDMPEPPEVRTQTQEQTDTAPGDPLMAHLHMLCRKAGLTLHSRCATMSFV